MRAARGLGVFEMMRRVIVGIFAALQQFHHER